jgi:hypothetical protein
MNPAPQTLNSKLTYQVRMARSFGSGVVECGTANPTPHALGHGEHQSRPRQSRPRVDVTSTSHVQPSTSHVQSTSDEFQSRPRHFPSHYRTKYRGTSLIRNSPLLGPYSRAMPRVLGGALWGPRGVGVFLFARYPCTGNAFFTSAYYQSRPEWT